MNTQWYEALDQERGRVEGQLSALLEQHPALEQAKEYLSKVNEDDFTGQFTANFDVGQLMEMVNAAYNEYLIDPTAANKAFADDLAYVLKAYIEKILPCWMPMERRFRCSRRRRRGICPSLSISWNTERVTVLLEREAERLSDLLFPVSVPQPVQ